MARKQSVEYAIPKMVQKLEPLINHYTSEDFLRNNLGADGDFSRGASGYMKRGGKYIRPAYVFSTAEGHRKIDERVFRPEEDGGLRVERIYRRSDVMRFIPAALSIQFDHTWFLIHDDIEDNSLMRRGDWAHHVYRGLDLAINDGDYLDTLSQRVILYANKIFKKRIWNKETISRMNEARADMVSRTVYGQNYEFKKRAQPLNEISKKDVLNILVSKTGYTTETPVKYANIVSGKSDSYISRLEKPLLDATIAFQMIDDVLNLTMKKEDAVGKADLKTQKVGKDYAGDLDEGKRTMPLVLLYEKCDRDEKKFLEKLYGSGGPFDNLKSLEETLGHKMQHGNRDDEVYIRNMSIGRKTKKLEYRDKQKIISMMKDYGVIEKSKDMAQKYLRSANDGIKSVMGQRASKSIIEINNFAVNRKF